ncbi:SDR family NAD(P)-dependent oxidoreductase [Thermodesulfobacteriota bacterium]
MMINSGGPSPYGVDCIDRSVPWNVTPDIASFDVAIVGMACIFPGAVDIQAYWHNILNKVDAIEEIPENRWNWELYYDPDSRVKDKINSKWGGFIPDTLFDPLEFGMPPNTLHSIEPLQLLLLKCVRSALDDSGYLNRPFDRRRTSVIIGAGGDSELAQTYSFRSGLPALFGESAAAILSGIGAAVPDWSEDTLPGVLMNVAAGRVANRFDLGGSNYSIDAACASSLAALKAGFLELRSEDSDMVIVGGADTIMNPFAYTCFSKTATLSPSGRSRPFDAEADGIVLSEGVAAILIKRLEDASRDGDRIYAVIKGISSSSDGRSKGLAAPRPEGQMMVLRRAYRQAGVPANTVELVEAHGTGTGVGDRSECEALNQVFSDSKMDPKHCALGSVKSMIGHPKRVAGLAALIKTALALHHKVLPPTINVEKPIREVSSLESPLYINAELKPWMNGKDHPRRAGVSSFGFGGTNFHTILEEHTDRSRDDLTEPALKEWPLEVLILRGESRSDLLIKIKELQDTIRRCDQLNLRDLSFSLSSIPGKEVDQCLAIVSNSLSDLENKLEMAGEGLLEPTKESIWKKEGIYYKDQPLGAHGKIAFIYPGQGSQYCGMMANLTLQFREVRDVFERFDDTLKERLDKPLSRYIYPPSAFSREESEANEKELMQTNVAQAAMGGADLAMHKLLAKLGVKPDIVAGHSYGEYVALHAAGAFSEEALALLSEARGRFMAETAREESGTMAAVRGGEEEVREVVERFEDLWIANLNSPEQTVISGAEKSVQLAMGALKEKGLYAVQIPTACAFHSPIVSRAQEKLGSFLEEIEISQPKAVVFSNTTAEPYPKSGKKIADRLVEHLVKPVLFQKEIEAIYEEGARIFVEVGAGCVLTKLVGRILGSKPFRAIHTDGKGESALERLQHVIAQLAAEGVNLDLDLLYRGRGCRNIREDGMISNLQGGKLSKTAWIIRGGKAAPAGEGPKDVFIPRPVGFQTLIEPEDDSAGNERLYQQKEVTREEDEPEMARAPEERELRQNTQAQKDDDDQVMMEFQKLMHKFLDTQKSVMVAYLNGEGERHSVPRDAELESSLAEFASAMPEGKKPAENGRGSDTPLARSNELMGTEGPIEKEAAQEKDLAPEKEEERALNNIESMVLNIVEERTGYPREVLDLDLDLEADLGLDSIKKVEILGALREYVEQCTGRPMAAEAEEVSRLATLRDVIDLVSGEVGTGPVTEALAGEPVEAKGGTPDDKRTVRGQEISEYVLSLVEERTGYPTEVLDLDLDLEADLGLDSIKKVEILGALREHFEKQIGIPLQIGAEEASRLTTLRGVIDLVSGEVGAGPAAEALAGEPVEAKGGTPDDKRAVRGQEISEYVLSLVEERTGYPREVLDLDLDLEADLGLDSIKKVEILGALKEHFEKQIGMPLQIGAEEASRLTTLRGVIDLVSGEVGVESSTDATDAGPSEKKEDAPAASEPAVDHDPGMSGIKRFLLEAVERPLVPKALPSLPEQTVIVSCNRDDEVADYVIHTLRDMKVQVVSIHHEKKVPQKAEDGFQADLTSAEDLSRIVEEIRGERDPIGGLIHLVPLAPGKPIEKMTTAEWQGRLEREVKSLFYLAKFTADDLQAAAKHGGGSIVAATGLGGVFASDPSAPSGTAIFPGSGGVSGFLKALAEECPEVNIRCMDVDLEETPKILGDQIIQEFMNASKEVEVGYRSGRRLSIELKEEAFNTEQTEGLEVDSSSIVLITGGARGITSTIALEMARDYQPTIILVGRSEEPGAAEPEETAGITDDKLLKSFILEKMKKSGEKFKPIEIERAYNRIMAQREMRDNMMKMRAFGAEVIYLQADVRDVAAFEALIDGIYKEHGRIDGVIHGAGLLRDKLVRDKEPQSFDSVFDTKVDSLFVFTRKLRPEALRFFTLFSSVAGRFGNRGQADYGAANEVYNKTAICLDGIWPARVVSFIWGPWESMGMVSEGVQKQFLERGIHVIPRSLGPRLFVQELIHGKKGEVEVVFGNQEKKNTEPPAVHREIRLPLLSVDTRISPQSNGKLVLLHRFDPSRSPYLRDHKLDGLCVVPMAIALEMIAEVVLYGWPEFFLKEIEDLQVQKGIVLNNHQEDIRIVAIPEEQSAEALTVDVQLIGTNAKPAVHYQARAKLIRKPGAKGTHEAISIQERAPFEMTMKEAYRQWLFHGPIFQGIKEIETLGSDGVVATLKPSFPVNFLEDVDGESSWIIDPLIIDSGLQLLVLWMRSVFNSTPLPTRFKNYTRFSKSPPDGDMRCEVRMHSNNGGGMITADLFFVLPDGNLYGVLEGMEVIGNKSFNRLSAKN